MDSNNPYAAPASELTHATDGDGAGVAPYTVGEMRSAFRRFAWAFWSYVGSIGLIFVGMIVLVVVVAVSGKGGSGGGSPFSGNDAGVMVLGLGFLLFMLLYLALTVLLVVYSCILLYRYWRVMQPYTTLTTPGKAVGFLFIPFYNLYWVFVAYHGLSKAIDSYIDSHPDTKAPRPQTPLVLVMAILFVISFVPYLGSLASLGLIVLLYLSKVRLNNSIIGVIADRARGDVTAAAPR